MSTSKVLQQANIIQIIGSTIRVTHPDISNNMRTTLADKIELGGTAMTVLDNNGFSDNDFFILGEIGDQETEEDDINGVVVRGTSLTVTNTLKFDHEIDAPVTLIYERAIKIYGAATNGGAGTLIASINAITTPIADAFMIQWNKQYTEYTLITSDTTYAFYYATYTDGVTEGPASDYVASSGITSNMGEYFIQQSLRMTNALLDNNYTRPLMMTWVNDTQLAITQYMFQDPQNQSYRQMDWDFEVAYDASVLLTENQNVYDLSSINLKYPDSEKGIIDIRIGDKAPLIQISYDEFDRLQLAVRETFLSAPSAVGATTITVENNIEFSDSGTIYLGPDQLTYTGKSGTTQLTGIPASGNGSITAISAIGAPVWQNVTPGLPSKYTVFDNQLYLDIPVDTQHVGFPLKIRYFKKLTPLTENTDTTRIKFTNAFQFYLASMIEERRGNKQKAMTYMADFNKIVLNNALASKSAVTDSYQYYDYELNDLYYLRSGIKFLNHTNN